MSWTRPTTAATCCSCGTATCWPTPLHKTYERTRDVNHWRKRFCPSSGTAPQPQQAEPAELLRHHRANPASARGGPPQRRNDSRRTEPHHHVDVLHVLRCSAAPGSTVAVQQRLPHHARSLSPYHHVLDHVDNHAARTCFRNVGANTDHAPASTRSAGRLRHRVLD